MAILKEEIVGSKIINEIESSNITKTEYDTLTKNWWLNLNMVDLISMMMSHTKFTHNLEWHHHKDLFLVRTYLKLSNTRKLSKSINHYIYM